MTVCAKDATMCAKDATVCAKEGDYEGQGREGRRTPGGFSILRENSRQCSGDTGSYPNVCGLLGGALYVLSAN